MGYSCGRDGGRGPPPEAGTILLHLVESGESPTVQLEEEKWPQEAKAGLEMFLQQTDELETETQILAACVCVCVFVGTH